MRLDEVITPPTKIAVTQRFNNSYDKFNAGYRATLPRKFFQFCRAKLDGSPTTNDYAFKSNTGLSGYWHYHIVKGKVIIIYKRVGDTIRLYDVVEHTAYDTPASSARLADWCNGLSDSDFTKLDVNSLNSDQSNIEELTLDQKKAIVEVIHEIIFADGFYILKNAIEKNDWQDLFDYITSEINDIDPSAIFSAFGGKTSLTNLILRDIKRFNKQQEYDQI